MEVPEFQGKMNNDIFLAWLSSIESFFVWHNLLEGKKVQFVTAKLKGPANMQWSGGLRFEGQIEELLK